MSFSNTMLRSIICSVDNAFVNGKSIDYFRCIIDQFSKHEYKEFLDDFKDSNKERISSYDLLTTNGYSKYQLYKNNNYEVNMIEWEKQAKSKIHNHSPNGCVLKLIDGSLIEDKFIYPENYNTQTYNLEPIKHTERNVIVPIHSFNKSKTHSYYMEGFHQITNINNDKSYSLHFYSPPDFIPKTN